MARSMALLLLALTGGVSNALSARCMNLSLEQEFARSTQVYLATLVLSEVIEGRAPPGIDAEQQQELIPPDILRFVFRTGQVYKGSVDERVEKRVDPSVFMSPTPLRFQDLTLRTQVLMFEPGSASGCSRTTVVDRNVERDILPRLKALSLAEASGSVVEDRMAER